MTKPDTFERMVPEGSKSYATEPMLRSGAESLEKYPTTRRLGPLVASRVGT